MSIEPSTIGFTLLGVGILISLAGWLGTFRGRQRIEWRLIDAQWGDLARYGGPALACFGAVASFIEFGV